MLRENFDEAPDFIKGVVERCWRDANDVGFAEIGLYSGRFQFVK